MFVNKLLSFNPNFDVEEKGGGGTGDGKTGDANSPEGSVSKAEHDKLKQDLEDMRLEIMTPEYIAYLEASQKPKKEEKKEAESKDQVDYTKMTPDQIVKLATEKAKADAAAEVAKIREEFSSKDNEAVKKEIAAFARATPDYEKFRPIMYGLSRDPKHADLSLQELYGKAKEYVKGFGPSEEDIRRSKASRGEKPGGSSNSTVKDKKYTADEAANEAWDEVVGDKGMPSA